MPDRPFITVNVATTLDGKIAPGFAAQGYGHVGFGSDEDRALMDELRAGADAVLIGGGTLRQEDPPLLVRDASARAARAAARGAPHPLNVTVVSALPDGLEAMAFFNEPATDKLVFTTNRSAPAAVSAASRLARVEVVGADESGRVDLVAVVRRLSAAGVGRLLLEGGGELNFAMLRAGLVDEVHLTLCPFVFGGRDAPSAFGGEGFPPSGVRKLALASQRVGARGEVFLRYTVLPEPAVLEPERPPGTGSRLR